MRYGLVIGNDIGSYSFPNMLHSLIFVLGAFVEKEATTDEYRIIGRNFVCDIVAFVFYS